MNVLPAKRRITVKRSQDLDTVSCKPAIPKECAAQSPRPHDDGVRRVAEAEEAFKIRDQAVRVIPYLGPTAGADECKVLADLHIAKPQRLGDGRRRDVGRPGTGHGS